MPNVSGLPHRPHFTLVRYFRKQPYLDALSASIDCQVTVYPTMTPENCDI